MEEWNHLCLNWWKTAATMRTMVKVQVGVILSGDRRTCHVDEACPICLLVVAVDPKVLLQYGIEALRLAIFWGWKAVERLALIPRSSIKRRQKWEVKIVSRSLMRVSGRP